MSYWDDDYDWDENPLMLVDTPERHRPSLPEDEDGQKHMRLVDAEKHIAPDGTSYEQEYRPSGLIVLKADNPPKLPEKEFGPGSASWVHYKVHFSASMAPNPDLKFKTIKINPHSSLGKAITKHA